MIRIFLGKLGSGKSLHAIKEMKDDTSRLKYYTNLEADFKNVEIIAEKEIIQEVIEKGKTKTKTEYQLNWNYWIKQKKPLNVIWDEIHLTAGSRRSMSKKNMIIMEFVAMARRITGMDEAGYGTLTFVAQTDFSIDKYIRHLANDILYHIMYWEQYCKNCNIKELRDSEKEHSRKCNYCLSDRTRKQNFFCIVYKFRSFHNFQAWELGMPGKWHYSKELIDDIEKYFKFYETLQIIH